MEFDKVLESRRSVRKFSSKKVSWKQLSEILNAATFSPSSGNQQNWRFIIVNDKDKKHQLAIASLRQEWMEDAPVLIVVCADTSKIKKFYENNNKELSLQNCAIAASNIMLKAADLELSSCYVSIFDPEAVSRTLKLSEDYIPEMIIAIGYPDDKPERKRRLTIDNLIHFNEQGKKKRPSDSF